MYCLMWMSVLSVVIDDVLHKRFLEEDPPASYTGGEIFLQTTWVAPELLYSDGIFLMTQAFL